MKKSFLLCLAMFVGVVLVGCSGSGNQQVPGKVSGTISYKGQPIKGGIMRFHAEGSAGYNATISTDGTYSATDIPIGDLVVTVDTESLKSHTPAPGTGGKSAESRRNSSQQKPPPGVTPPPSMEDLYVKIPAKYSNPKSSPITVKIVAGRNVHNIDLTD